MYARFVFCMSDVLQLTAHVGLLGEPWAVCLQYVASQPVSSSLGLYAHTP